MGEDGFVSAPRIIEEEAGDERQNTDACSNGMSQGTRCRQLAEYVIFDSPLNMLCDSPSNYMKEKECTEFIAAVPEVWDETVGLDGKVGEYIAIARRSGSDILSYNDFA